MSVCVFVLSGPGAAQPRDLFTRGLHCTLAFSLPLLPLVAAPALVGPRALLLRFLPSELPDGFRL